MHMHCQPFDRLSSLTLQDLRLCDRLHRILMSAPVVPFQGGAYALDAQQNEVWKVLHNERNSGPGVGEKDEQAASWQSPACVVTLRSKVGSEASFYSKAQVNGRWTAEERTSNLTVMKKLWRHEHPEEKTKRKRKGGQSNAAAAEMADEVNMTTTDNHEDCGAVHASDQLTECCCPACST